MYFETTMHSRTNVASPDEAAKRIHEGQVRDYDCFVWRAADGREIAVVADNHCNNPWMEVAVVDLTNRTQLESITMGWIDDESEKARYLRECETQDFKMKTGVKIPMDGEHGNVKAQFECGCCGKSFTSTYEKQRKFDQDNGYGMCASCAR
jgi:hypothetical protein